MKPRQTVDGGVPLDPRTTSSSVRDGLVSFGNQLGLAEQSNRTRTRLTAVKGQLFYAEAISAGAK